MNAMCILGMIFILTKISATLSVSWLKNEKKFELLNKCLRTYCIPLPILSPSDIKELQRKLLDSVNSVEILSPKHTVFLFSFHWQERG